MEQKMQSLITDVTVDDAVFHDETFQPTLINFFFGKNGSGKSTIAKTLRKPEECKWQTGVNPDDLEIQIYNEDFIEENIQSYGNIPGVFTITKQDATAQQRIGELKARKNTVMKELMTARGEEQKAQDANKQAYTKMSDDVWKTTRGTSAEYKETQVGFLKDKKKFANELMLTKPVNHEKEDIAQRFKTAYSSDSKKYAFIQKPQLANLPNSDLLGKQIVNSGSTPYAEFVKALNSLSWVQQGHREFHDKADGKCPYCHQTLPENFEEDLASCYDEQYKQEMDDLEQFYKSYSNTMNGLLSTLNDNLETEFETPILATYKDKVNLFEEKGKNNIELIKAKIQKPEEAVSLENLDDILQDLEELISQINAKIQENNNIIDDIDTQKQNVTQMVWETMAYDCQGAIAEYKTLSQGYEEQITKARKQQKDLDAEINKIDSELSELNSRTTNTTVVMEDINRELDYNGFHGFRLQEKKGTQYVYELVRDDGSVARNLSEGERHIIAFLYFYHLVTGSQSDDGQQKDKIVIIDDPVSSMDSNSMSMVAQLIRNMINICHNNQDLSGGAGRDDYIKQFFCLTHNPYFFQEITYNRISDYRCVSFFELRKDPDNVSKITLCVEDSHKPGGGEINYSPVKNYYDGLWDEYKKTNDPIAIVNVMKAILEYFFIQMCGYTSSDLRAKLLEEKDNGEFPEMDYNLADALLELLDTERKVMGDGIFFDRSQVDVKQCREVFEKLFTLIGQDQHYQTRMEE